MTIRFNIEDKDDRVIVRLEGRIGGEASITLYSDIKSILSDHENKNLILDFGGVDFIDSSGLGSLVAINTHMVKKKLKMTLTSIPDNLMGLLKITNLLKILNIERSPEDA